MSRIGNAPITIPEKVEVSINGNTVKVTGSKGALSLDFEKEFVSVKLEDGILTVVRLNDGKECRGRHGLYRSLLQNLIEGVTNGFSKSLEIKGVGYRAALKGKTLEMMLGFSHPVLFEIPDGIEIKFDEKNSNLFTVSGIDKQLVGQVSAEIRSFKKPEPYKGKGIRYTDEHVARKAGKTASK